MSKFEAEFFPTSEAPWSTIPGPVEGLSERILTRDPQTGIASRMLRFAPGTDTSPDGVLTHEFWEEVYILEGSIHDLRLKKTFSAGMYACRPPGMPHGPWVSPEGCITFEVRYSAIGEGTPLPPPDVVPAQSMQDTTRPQSDPRLMRRTMTGFATGIAIITTAVDGKRYGMTVNSLTFLSMNPPLLLVCLTNGARTTEAVKRRGAFSISMFNERQEALANRFAQPGEDHFASLPQDFSASGLPVLPRGVGRLECQVETTYPGGDHTIVIGRVIHCEPHEGNPLIVYRRRYHRLHGEGHEIPWFW